MVTSCTTADSASSSEVATWGREGGVHSGDWTAASTARDRTSFMARSGPRAATGRGSVGAQRLREHPLRVLERILQVEQRGQRGGDVLRAAGGVVGPGTHARPQEDDGHVAVVLERRPVAGSAGAVRQVQPLLEDHDEVRAARLEE